jgi:hypothetical protein
MCCRPGQAACNGTCCASGSCLDCHGIGVCDTCLPGQIVCDEICINASSDPKNCGACGNTCTPAEVCCDSKCISYALREFHKIDCIRAAQEDYSACMVFCGESLVGMGNVQGVQDCVNTCSKAFLPRVKKCEAVC